MRTLLRLLAALVLVPTAAFAADPAPAPAPPAPSATAVFVDGNGAFERQLSSALLTEGVDLVDFAEAFPPPPPPDLSKGEQLFEEGKQAYNNLDPETAANKLTEAATFYASHPAEVDPEKLARTFFFLGAVSLLNGNKDKAVDAFRRALTLAPNAEPESDLFGQDVHDLYAETRGGMLGLLRGNLEVDSQPSGATASIDGKDAGLTPVEPRELPIGRHQVVLRRPGYVPFGAFPDVLPDAPTQLRPVLEPTPGMAKALTSAKPLLTPAAFAQKDLPPQAKALGQSLDARFLVLAVAPPQTKKAEVQAWDLSTGNKLVGITVDLSGDDWRTTSEAAAKVAAWIANPPAPPEPAFAFEAPPLLKKWWFWAAVGGVAAGVAGVAVVSQSGGHRPNFVLGLP